ncbi:MAG: GNAT family N-acetyltransferase [Taibaiella sp.]|nr:GNAT family N-acetyltransferase [Taibaiella sp.]
MIQPIETERLVIRPLSPVDLPGMFAMDSDPEVHKYLGNNPAKSMEDEAKVIEIVTRQYADLGIGRWAVVEKATGDFVGWTGFKRIVTPINGHVNHLDFGYRLARKHWGKGYATESGRAALNYGLNELGLADIHAMTHIENAASRYVLEKLGFSFISVFPYDGDLPWVSQGHPITWYSLGR